MAAMKTPGVYIVEKNAFPNSVVEVATAVPAFIGYTAKAIKDDRSVAGVPTRVTSLAEFENWFGTGADVRVSLRSNAGAGQGAGGAQARVARFKRSVGAIGAGAAIIDSLEALKAAEPADDAEKGRYEKVVAHFDEFFRAAENGAGNDENTDKLKERVATGLADGGAFAASALLGDDDVLKAFGVAVDDYVNGVDWTAVASAVDGLLAEDAKDRPLLTDAQTALADWCGGDGSDDALRDTARTRASVLKRLYPQAGQNNAPAAAAPASSDIEDMLALARDEFCFYRNIRFFYQNGGGPCYIVSVGDYSESPTKAGLAGGLKPLIKEQEPTMVVIPEAVRIPQDDCYSLQQAVVAHCKKMASRFAILDIYNGDQQPEYCINEFRERIGINHLDWAAAYYPWLKTTVVDDGVVTFANFEDPEALLAQMKERDKKALPADEMAGLKLALANGDSKDINRVHNLLSNFSPSYKRAVNHVREQLNLLPPAAAMAGIYTMVDNDRGVWKAPANVSLNSVIAPAVNISHDEQEDLNVPTNGKAVNAIRSFVGEGTLVWGARTLDGNSLDWRYLNVRRTMIMLEESIRLACKAYVFEPNNANTWVTIKSMIRNFLNGIWKRGGLAGAAPDQAYSVSVGLGETMVPEDILEGILRVTVLVAISRPAEFIEITFQQKMQES